jgi:peptidoglycan/LPS O-acetylase OafA/YrhL
VDVFLAGVLAAVVARGEWWERMVRERAAFLRAVVWGVVGLLVVASCVFVAARFLIFEQVWPMLRHFSFLYGAGFAVVVLGVSHLDGRLSDWMNHKFLRLIGVTCFSWYLLHFVAINLVHGWFGFRWTPQLMGLPWSWLEPAKFVLSFALTLVVSVVTYLVVEKPFILISRRFVMRKGV